MSGLFRKEALQAQGQRLLGEVLIVQPVSLRWTALCLVAGVLALLLLIAQAPYARKETVTGYIAPGRGIMRIGAPRAGVVTRMHAREGDVVQQGAPLVTIDSGRVTLNGLPANARMLASIDARIDETRRLESILNARVEQRERELRLALEGLSAARSGLVRQSEIQHEILALAEANRARLRGLSARGFVRQTDLAAREAEVLAAGQQLSALAEQLASNRSDRVRTEASIAGLPLELQERLSDLRSQRANLELQKLQIGELGPVTVAAPAAGRVAAGIAVEGETVVPQQALLSLLPADSRFEAHLFVPTRAIGFIRAGQDVRILYDAFDFRKFGAQSGIVTEVASAALPADESFRQVQRNEPTYRVRVRLSDRLFESRHGSFELAAGMTLRADIVLETRTVASWILNPILSIRGRT